MYFLSLSLSLSLSLFTFAHQYDYFTVDPVRNWTNYDIRNLRREGDTEWSGPVRRQDFRLLYQETGQENEGPILPPPWLGTRWKDAKAVVYNKVPKAGARMTQCCQCFAANVKENRKMLQEGVQSSLDLTIFLGGGVFIVKLRLVKLRLTF